MDISYILNHLGENRGDYFNAVAPPLIQTSNFAFPTVKALREGFQKEYETPFYTRGHNPTVAILRQKLAALEGTADALVFASGSAAVAMAVISAVKAGDHVVCMQKPYTWTNLLLSKLLARFGVTVSFVDGRDTALVEAAIKPNTSLIYLETPNSITFEIQDLKTITTLAKARNITTIADNSHCSPLLQQPHLLGVDLVVHSATKYLNGHSDVVAGVVCGSSERIRKMMEEEFMTLGAIISPNDAWLILRGLRTLELRVNQSCETAAKLVEVLRHHPQIEKVLYPFHPDSPQLALAKQQMRKGGGLFTITLRVSHVEQVERFCDALNYFLMAVSWGGHESLIFPTCAVVDDNTPPDAAPLNWRMIRFYIGLENYEVLERDILQALDRIAE